jgi:hypothetical protein
MMEDDVKKALAAEDQPAWATELHKSTQELVDMSRRAMSKYHSTWDNNNDVYRGFRPQDKNDVKAKERGEPTKMVVPVTYSQAQTFTAFVFALYTQRERMFELSGTNDHSHKAAKIGEALLQRDLVYNLFEAKLYQMLVDVARFSIGVLKTSWCRKTQMVRETVTTPAPSFLGIPLGKPRTEEVESVTTKFLGNEISSVSPYRFYPDTRLPLTRFQDGEFCASEDEYSMTQLQQMEADGYVSGVEWITTMNKSQVEKRGGVRMSTGFSAEDETSVLLGNSKRRGTVVVTEVQRVIIPSQFKLDGKVLDKDNNRPTKYLVWYANDSRVIRFEKMGYMHEQFTYDVAMFSPDMNELCSLSLADTIDQLQSVITWFINARITSVRKVIQNYLVVDTEGIEIKDLENRNPVIRLKAGAGRQGIDRWIKQLAVTDVTTNHIGDAKFLQELVQLTTGINENMLGQFHSGRRSASEARNVMSSAASRLKMIATLIFRMCLEPMGRKMISNLRDGLDEETMVKVVGINKTAAGGSEFAPVTKKDLVGSYDFDVFDGTLPSEKGATADVLQGLVEGFFKSPEAAIALGIDPKAALFELLELRGVRNPERFFLPSPPPPAPTPGAPAAPGQLSPAGPGGQPMPDVGALLASLGQPPAQ